MNTVSATQTASRTAGIPAARKPHLLPLIFFAAAYVFLILLFPHLYHLTPFYNRTVSGFIKLGSYCLLGILGIVLFRDLYAAGLREWKAHPLKNLGLLIGCFLAVQISDMIVVPFAMAMGYESMNQTNVEVVLNAFPALLTILGMGVLGPVTEETIFRFTMVVRGKEKFPVWLCIIVSSVAFMLLHTHAFTLNEVISCLPQLTTGLILAVLVVKCKNPTIPVLVHILNNVIALAPAALNK